MPPTGLRLLGVPALVQGDAVRPLPVDLRAALVGVLACHDAPMARHRLAAVFWPEVPDRAARQNLRQLLHRTRDLLGRAAIGGTSVTVELAYPHDLTPFRHALALGDAVAVVRTGLAPLLEGLEHVANEEWQAWLALERGHLDEMARRVVLDAAARWAVDGPPPSVLGALAEWVDRDPFDDEVHAAYLRCARHVPGEAGAAAARLARVTAFIAGEVGGGLAEDVVLASTWLGERQGAGATAPPPERPWIDEPVRRAGTGPAEGPLLGREAELASLDAAVADDATRVVTVHGPGGIGKTRLVRAWAGRSGHAGVPIPLVAIAGATGPADAARSLAQAHGWTFGDGDDDTYVAERLVHGPRVIVLDEAEGLPWLPGWIKALLAAAPALTVVLTSRERLRIAGEQVLRLTGLPLPDGDDPATALASAAVRLFVRAARRVRPDLVFGEDDLAAVTRFARRVEGSPFALTVAAGWLQLGPPAVLLDAALDDPDDPLAIAGVVGRSWQRLGPSERSALAALSVFPERFDIDAALEVASCSRRTLLRLVDRSLVQPGTVDGLVLHALVRHHAARRLMDDPTVAAGVRTRHARYVAERLGAQSRALWAGAGQWQAHVTILAHVADLRQAWSWGCDHDDVEVLDALADTVWSLEIRGWHELGAELTEAAIASLERVAAADPERGEAPLARALARRGIFAHRLDDAVTTRATAERARAIFERRGDRVDPFVWFHLGIAAWFEGDLTGAETWHRHLLAEAEAHGDVWAAGGARANLGLLAHAGGDHAAAETFAREALDAALAQGDGWGITLAAGNLAAMVHPDGSEEEVISLLELAIRYADRYAMEASVMSTSVQLGQVLCRTGRREEAATAFLRARDLLDAGVRPAQAGSLDRNESAADLRAAIEDALAAVDAARR